MTEDAERVLLAEEGVTVSTSRFVVGATTYPLATISAVSSYQIPPNRSVPYLLILVGLPLIFLYGVGLIVIALAIWWAISIKPTFSVRIATAGGQMDAVSSQNCDYVNKIVVALNNAVIQRG